MRRQGPNNSKENRFVPIGYKSVKNEQKMISRWKIPEGRNNL